MYTGQIYYKGEPITVQQAVDLKLITVDDNGDIWLYNDTAHLIRITGDLKFRLKNKKVICQNIMLLDSTKKQGGKNPVLVFESIDGVVKYLEGMCCSPIWKNAHPIYE